MMFLTFLKSFNIFHSIQFCKYYSILYCTSVVSRCPVWDFKPHIIFKDFDFLLTNFNKLILYYETHPRLEHLLKETPYACMACGFEIESCL